MQLVPIIVKALYVRDEYASYVLSTEPPATIDDLIKIIGQYTDFNIEIFELDWPSRQIRGTIQRFDSNRTAKIYVAPRKAKNDDPAAPGVTFCEHRFATIKEACHLLIDHHDTYTNAVEPLIESLIYREERIVSDLPECSQSEIYAIVAALELLFPWEVREGFKERIAKGELSHYDVANLFKIPERQVTWILSDRAHPALISAHGVVDELQSIKERNI